MAVCVVIWTEALAADGAVTFQWNGRGVRAGVAFAKLAALLTNAKARNSRVVLVVKGRLGRDVQWESSALAHVNMSVRQVFVKWYTQAVQAQAALAKQQVSLPTFD